jgi:ribosomal protein S18 acetylase RimI-like enzyme
MPDPLFQIRPARSATDLEAAVQLFNAYASSLGIDLCFQDFATELRTLPGKYAPPDGELLLARDIFGDPMGCVGLRPIAADGCCEMKRLYVSPRARGLGLGKALIEAIIAEAERIGYQEMRLDTLPTMAEAIALYRKAGFMPIKAYYDTPLAGTIFLARALAARSEYAVETRVPSPLSAHGRPPN